MQDWNRQDRKMQDQLSELENAGPEFVGPNVRKMWDQKMRDWKKRDLKMVENEGPWLFYSKCCFRVVNVTLHTKLQVVFWWFTNDVIAIFFHVLPVLRMTWHFHIMALWHVICIPKW